MTKTYAILQKKLQELEQLSPNNLTTNIRPSLSQEIHQKLVFIANLLSAEIASCPTKPRHLNYIARRLARLEVVLRDSEASKDLLDDHVDDSSTGLCTESCLDDDGEVASRTSSSCLEGERESTGEYFYECVEGEKEEKEVMMKKEERKVVGVAKICGAMASGFLIGMVLMAVAVFPIEFFGFLQVQQNGGFVTPT